jgi:hypothetical protein
MYQKILSDEQMSDFFSEKTINRFRATIIRESENVKFEEPKTAALGAFCLDEIQTNNGKIVNVFIEYNIFKQGEFLNAGFNKCCFWTGIMPDFVLDRFNELKKVLNEND